MCWISCYFILIIVSHFGDVLLCNLQSDSWLFCVSRQWKRWRLLRRRTAEWRVQQPPTSPSSTSWWDPLIDLFFSRVDTCHLCCCRIGGGLPLTLRTNLLAVVALGLIFRLLQEKDYDQADRYADLAMNADRYNPAALNNKGNTVYSRQDYEKAAEFYKEALRNDSSCTEALYNLGNSLPYSTLVMNTWFSSVNI